MSIKKSITSLLLLLITSSSCFAHYLWIETAQHGKIGKQQDIKVFFGEYTYGVIEDVKGEAFPSVKDFTLWLVAPNGTKSKISVTENVDHYLAHFTPTSEGVYTVVLDNDKIDVIDYTKYDFGIFRTHYNSVAKVNVGTTNGETVAMNETGITIKDVSKYKDEVQLQVLYKNKPLAENELTVFVTDLWSKTLNTDENGMVTFKLPWNTKYIVETTFKEEVPGSYNGEDYEFIWHCATYCIL